MPLNLRWQSDRPAGLFVAMKLKLLTFRITLALTTLAAQVQGQSPNNLDLLTGSVPGCPGLGQPSRQGRDREALSIGGTKFERGLAHTLTAWCASSSKAGRRSFRMVGVDDAAGAITPESRSGSSVTARCCGAPLA